MQVNVHLWQYVRWHAEANRSSPQSDSCTMAGNDGARVSESRARGSHSTHPCSSTGNMWSLGDSAFKKQLAEGDSFKVRVHMRKKQSGLNYEEVTAPAPAAEGAETSAVEVCFGHLGKGLWMVQLLCNSINADGVLGQATGSNARTQRPARTIRPTIPSSPLATCAAGGSTW